MIELFKKSLLVSSVVILTQINLIAQSTTSSIKQNQLYIELGGNGMIYSINYERSLSENFTFRGGFGITPGLIFAEGTFLHIPVTASYLIGGVSSKFETGLGVTYFAGTDIEVFGLPSDDQSLIFLAGIVGYRYISPGGFVFRIAFTPFYNSQAEPNFIPSGGLSFGFMF